MQTDKIISKDLKPEIYLLTVLMNRLDEVSDIVDYHIQSQLSCAYMRLKEAHDILENIQTD